jgi:outer membrane immunogenic protein
LPNNNLWVRMLLRATIFMPEGAVMTGRGEIGFAPNWSVAFEYDHLFMGNNNETFPQSAIAVTRSDNIRQDVDMGTVRLNYRFGGPVVAKY